MFIRFYLSLAAKSMFTYEELPNSNIRDYKIYIRPKTGFHENVIQELIKLTNNYFYNERCCVII